MINFYHWESNNMNKLNLLDDHRSAWSHLVGQRKTFRGTISRFGHKHRQGAQIKKGATLVLTDVHQYRSKNQIDHVWIDYTPELAQFGEHLRPNGIIEFDAIVSSYVKGGKNIYGKGEGTFDDLELTDVKNVTIIKEPYFPKSYDALIDDDFISYIIKTRQNLASGKSVGKDPYGKLGTIKIGQGFCNRFAKTLSWKWINTLPKKYGGGKQ